MFIPAMCENDPSVWFIFVGASRLRFLITKLELPSAASGCIYQTRERISVSRMCLKEASCISGYLSACNFCLLFLLFCYWPSLRRLGGIPEGEQWNAHFRALVRIYRRKWPDSSWYYLGVLVLFLEIQFSWTYTFSWTVWVNEPESDVQRWSTLEDLMGLKSELGLPPSMGVNVRQE